MIVREFICTVSRRLTLICQEWCSSMQTDANSVCFDMYPCFKLNLSSLHGSQMACCVPAAVHCWFPQNHIFQEMYRLHWKGTHTHRCCVLLVFDCTQLNLVQRRGCTFRILWFRPQTNVFLYWLHSHREFPSCNHLHMFISSAGRNLRLQYIVSILFSVRCVYNIAWSDRDQGNKQPQYYLKKLCI